MDERVARLKSPKEAKAFASNARRLGHPDLEAAALDRARQLQAIEEGHTSPAQQAIAAALYAYEEQQSQLTGRNFRASRTRQMLARHGALETAERLVLRRERSTGFDVLEQAGLQELSFESIIDRFPDEFSERAVMAARARLDGKATSAMSDAPTNAATADGGVSTPIVPDAEAQAFLNGYQDPNTWFKARWLPRYRETTQIIAQALAENRPEDLFDILWKTVDNHISAAGQGQLKFDVVDAMRDELVEVIRDIHQDGSPANFDRIVERFEGWKSGGRISKVPRLLIARAFAGLHPHRYHTTVDWDSHNQALRWFVEHTGFVMPRSVSWAARAQALVAHLDHGGMFGDDILVRNMFPWFVVDQLRARTGHTDIPPGHVPRPNSTFSDLPPAQRIIALRHNEVQTYLYACLVEEFGHEKVWTEYPTGTGGSADAVAQRPDGRRYLYEIKIARTAAEVVRQAMGQLLEYAFRKGGLEPARLFAVGEPPMDTITRHFLGRLRAEFNLDIDYLQVELPGERSIP